MSYYTHTIMARQSYVCMFILLISFSSCIHLSMRQFVSCIRSEQLATPPMNQINTINTLFYKRSKLLLYYQFRLQLCDCARDLGLCDIVCNCDVMLMGCALCVSDCV